MELLDWIIKIGSGITALGVIFGLLLAAFKLAFKPIAKKIDNNTKHTEENYMAVLRLTIMSNEMPIGERIVAGQKYLDRDGNGEIKKFLEKEFNITKPTNEAPHYKK